MILLEERLMLLDLRINLLNGDEDIGKKMVLDQPEPDNWYFINWYKCPHPFTVLVYVTSIVGEDARGVGIGSANEWIPIGGGWHYPSIEWIKAPLDQVSEKLIIQAQGRGFKVGSKVSRKHLSPLLNEVTITDHGRGYIYNQSQQALYLEGAIIFRKGQWANIIN